MELHDLPNIGAVLESQLKAVGINTPNELREVGTKEAFIKLKAYDSGSCMHKLLAIEGAVQGIPKKTLSAECREDLKAFFDELD